MLRADPGARDPQALPGSRQHYLTGSRKDDAELEEQISILLSGS
jgi:hypothetical protein